MVVVIQSYLSGRTQTFQTQSTTSDVVALDCSVPQGSVVGPQQFVCYTEDVEETIVPFSVDHHLYADDTQLQSHMRLHEVQMRRHILGGLLDVIITSDSNAPPELSVSDVGPLIDLLDNQCDATSTNLYNNFAAAVEKLRL